MGLFNKNSTEKKKVSAVIVAAGKSSRMGDIDKQSEEIMGIPVIVHSMLAFEQNENISEIVLVTKSENILPFTRFAQMYDITKLKSVVKGGDSRQKSVLGGIAETSPDTDYYCIHDGARPLVSQKVIDTAISDAIAFSATTAAVKVKDTIKVGSANFVKATPDRSSLYQIQTPQIFASNLYRTAAEQAAEKGEEYTDDCQLIEAVGHNVYLSEGDYFNIKITTPEDLVIAEALLSMII